jgi:acyl-homoserine-lactone acylase
MGGGLATPKVARRVWVGSVLLFLVGACTTGRARPVGAPGHVISLPELAHQVQIRRTTYGVPQILAQNLRAAAFALAYVQLEDYGPAIINGMQAARGRSALVEGVSRVDSDARARLRHARARRTFRLLQPDTRDVYHGFAAGINHYIRVYRNRLPAWMKPDFTAQDVFARDIGWPSDAAMNEFRARLLASPTAPLLVAGEAGAWRRASAEHATPLARSAVVEPNDEIGSNAWALAPSRTTSGHAILLRNPHLAWSAGYYEAHLRVPGKLDFYGDFRIGGPFSVIGGFNRFLGFATTNNANRTHEFYAFRVDRAKPNHILLDGVSVPLRRDVVTIEYRDSSGADRQTREFWNTPFGPVVHRDSLVYVFRPALNGDYRAGEQWLAMMKATSLAEWQAAMRIQARETSNFTYADRAGNILYVWVSATPFLPHPDGGDTLAILATRGDHVWQRLVPFDSLPQVLNPPGGYIHNENDSPHFTNLNRILSHASFSFWVQPPQLRLRSQHALQILHNDRKFSLEDVVVAKHSMRMLLADRVKDALIAAVRRTNPEGDVARALELLVAWDNTVAAESRGGLLFETWWNRYRTLVRGEEPHAVGWRIEEPATTPRGLAHPELAADAFVWAVTEAARRFGSWDAAWGDVHRVRRGNVDVPVGGCSGALGCFRVLNFTPDSTGKRIANGGDGWVLAVEFGDEPRAYSVLAYGQSPNPASPYHDNQAALFAANRMKPVHWTEEDIARAVVRQYRPGEERRGRLWYWRD